MKLWQYYLTILIFNKDIIEKRYYNGIMILFLRSL